MQLFFIHITMFSSQEAETSIKYFRGINNTNAADEQQSTPMEQVKIEFESIKSLINERTSGEGKVAVKDFCETRFEFFRAKF